MANPDGMSRIVERKNHWELQLTGELDFYQASILHQNLLSVLDSSKDVVVNWNHTERIDACVLQLLLALRQGVVERGRKFRSTPWPPAVEASLELANCTEFFPHTPRRS